MLNFICKKVEYTIRNERSDFTQKSQKKITMCLLSIYSPLLLGLAPSIFAQTAIPSQATTYTLFGVGPFVLNAPDTITITTPGAIGISGNNTANWDLTIANGAAVTSASGVFLGSLSGDTVLNNAGTITATSTSGYGVRLNAGGTINNTSSGVIDSQGDVVYVTAGGTVNNDGVIRSPFAMVSTGVYFNTGGTYVGGSASSINSRYGIIVNSVGGSITNAGNIDAQVIGVQFRNNATGTLINEVGGKIASQGDAVHFGAAGSTVDNRGLIRSGTGTTAVYFNAGGTYASSNTSTLNGGYGVIINGGSGSVTNAGNIDVVNAGVWFRGNAGGTVTNLAGGAIIATGSASTQYGVRIDGSSNVQINNAGAISGGTGVLLGSNNHHLTNSSSITGTAGNAILITGNNNAVTLRQGSSLTGNITSTGSGNTLTLQDSGVLPNNLSGLQSVIVDAGANQSWTLNGSTMSTNGTNASALTVQSGTLILDGDLTHAGAGGGSTIASGATLQIGNGGAAGSVNGDIVDHGVLVFNRSDNVSFAGQISGSGALVKDGAGTLTLTSPASSYSGATIVNSGILQAGAANIIDDSGALLVQAGAAFNLNGSNQQVNQLTGDGDVHLTTSALTANYTHDDVFGGVIDGTGTLTKTGSGTMVLTGGNTYTGITTISGGALQLGNGGTTGSVASDIVNNSTLVFNRGDDYAYNGVVSGGGNLIQQGDGSLLFSQDQTYSGATEVRAGSLVLNNAQLTGGGQVNVMAGAMLGGYGEVSGDVVNQGVLAVADAAPGFAGGPAGQFVVGGDLTNSGEIRMASVQPANTLQINGNYIGTNGLLTLSTQLGDDNSATDKLIVQGNTSGATRVIVNNVGGTGAITQAGIEVIQVNGTSNGTFTLANRVSAGAYDYSLGQLAPGSWRLYTQPENVRPEAGANLANRVNSAVMFTHRLSDRGRTIARQANRNNGGSSDGSHGSSNNSGQYIPSAHNQNVWGRLAGWNNTSKAAGGAIDQDSNVMLVQFGVDVLSLDHGNNRTVVGLMTGYGHSDTDTRTHATGYTADSKVDGYSVGAYATWYGNADQLTGPYVDAWAQYGWYDNKVSSPGSRDQRYDSNSLAVSVETGYTFAIGHLNKQLALLEPQLQVGYTHFSSDDYRDENNTRVYGDNDGDVFARVGLRLSTAGETFRPFIEANWLYGDISNSLRYGDQTIEDDTPENRYEIKIGASGNLSPNWQMWGNAGGQWGKNDYRSFGGEVGVRYLW